MEIGGHAIGRGHFRLNIQTDMHARSRGARRPSYALILPLFDTRAQGKPGARCTRGLVRKWKQESAHEHTGSAEAIRPSLRNGFTAYSALSPVTGFLATVTCE
jgi:hypothetical protein